MSWTESPLGRQHDRNSFDCGEAPLNEYLKRFARQNHDSGGAKTFVASPTGDAPAILGYYTISPASIAYARTPKIVTKGLGRYDVPVFRLGRLAVDKRSQGEGLGGKLLFSAGERCLAVAEQVGGIGLLIDALSPRAAAWYQTFGALPFDDAPLCLILQFSTLARA